MAGADRDDSDPTRGLRLGAVHLAVADLARSVDFYTRVLGLHLIAQGQEGAILGADPEQPLLQLTRLGHASPVPPHSTGLFHVALLHPTRADLARTVLRLAGARWPLTGASDHGVSEAVYLDDPDGLGLEVYADRPREQWQRADDGSINMYTLPLDLAGLLASAPEGSTPEIAPGTHVGHVHLKVSDLERAVAFYAGALGLELQARMPSAAFLAADGYHHHVGLNTWSSLGASPPPATAPGLRLFEVGLDGDDALAALTARLAARGVPASVRSEAPGLVLQDPDHNALALEAVVAGADVTPRS